MDLSILVEDTILYIKSMAIIRTPKGILFEKMADRYYIFPVGGKLMINENSKEAVIREVKEEIGMDIKDAKLCAVIENFFSTSEGKQHEICFVYKVDEIFTGPVPEGFIEVAKEDLDKYEIKPTPIVEILKEESDDVRHFLIK